MVEHLPGNETYSSEICSTGEPWPIPRADMRAPSAIIARMAEDVVAMQKTGHQYLKDEAVFFGELKNLGWPPQIAGACGMWFLYVMRRAIAA